MQLKQEATNSPDNLTLTTIVHLVDKYTLLHSDYLPNMGMRSCWFASEWGFA